MKNPYAAFQGQPITVDDVLESRYINRPLKLLESVMPCDGAAALIVTTAERAKALPNRPVYLMGVGMEQGAANIWQTDNVTVTPTAVSAPRALEMSGYKADDMESAQFYD